MLDIARLRVLDEVARQGSLTRAAEALSYTTSAVSQQITVLEREAGARLLERHARGVRLTEAGRALVRHTAVIMSEVRAAESAVAAVADGSGGRVRFGSFTTANATLMPQAVRAFQRDRPGVALELTEVDRDEALAAMATHRLDLALVYEFPVVPLEPSPGIDLLPLLVDPLHVALPPRHRLAHRGRLRLTDLADESWIQGVHHGSTMDVLPRACREAGFEPRIAFRTDDQMTVRGLVAAGLGVALAPWLTLPATPSGLVVRPLAEPSLTRTVMTATPAAPYRLPAVTVMIDHLRDVAADLAAACGPTGDDPDQIVIPGRATGDVREFRGPRSWPGGS
ncbi:LysR family transcriptional regulator [Nonomuraea diastatica]|uniref:LysR family transcriptional regulator n=1 Tax=Nonomuraea diastatica TaxID=1848329 RepID=A0A4R4X392_9ACTN|nr:LysR family transcriptional regulator [Nonomuraea diastatica]TDD24730.1 LysR family transcriptional regulator [Nonomuraea diastatica]